MQQSDKVKLEFYSGGGTFSIVCDRSAASAFKTAWLGVTDGKIEVSGRVNDIDGNEMNLAFDSNAIQGIQIMEINRT